jgi:hypothetical protein
LVEKGICELALTSDVESDCMLCEKLFRKLVLAEPAVLKMKEHRATTPYLCGAKLVNFIKRCVKEDMFFFMRLTFFFFCPPKVSLLLLLLLVKEE